MNIEELKEGQLVLLNIDNGGMMVYARFIPPAAFETFTRFGTVANRLTNLDPKRVEILTLEQFMPTSGLSLFGEKIYTTGKGEIMLRDVIEKWQLAEGRINRAYRERNIAAVLAVKQALMLGLNAGKGLDDNTNWDAEWRTVIYANLPDGGQISWHISPDDLELVEDLPEYEGEWDRTFESRRGDLVCKLDWRCSKWTCTHVIRKFVDFVKKKVGL